MGRGVETAAVKFENGSESSLNGSSVFWVSFLKTLGHRSREISKVVWFFMRHEITG